MNKKMLILMCFFSMLTLISSIISSCLVFYNEKARTEINSNKVLASSNNYLNASIRYYENNTLNLSNLSPGYSITQSFSITNNNSDTIKYNIEWEKVTSTWNITENSLTPHPDEFTYSLSCTNGEKVESKTMPIDNNDNIIFENLSLKTNKTNECEITITFINTWEDQSYNLNKSFNGTYKIVLIE